MINGLSKLIAIGIVIGLAVILYPLYGVFWAVGKVGFIVGICADALGKFTHCLLNKILDSIREENQITIE